MILLFIPDTLLLSSSSTRQVTAFLSPHPFQPSFHSTKTQFRYNKIKTNIHTHKDNDDNNNNNNKDIQDVSTRQMELDQQQPQQQALLQQPSSTFLSDQQQQQQQENMALTIKKQQEQINLLLQLFTQQQQQQQKQQSIESNTQQQQPQQQQSIAPVKLMMFIDGTWLYYSLYGRGGQSAVSNAFGPQWHHRYSVHWDRFASLITDIIQSYYPNRPVEMNRVSCYTSMKDDPTSINRRRMFQEMAKTTNYDVSVMTTEGRQEKCIDIQLTVELLHYATVPNNPYDVGIIVTGDKDFLPAITRVRQRARKICLVTMQESCNRALIETPNDFDIIWLEHYLHQFILQNNHTHTPTTTTTILSRVVLDYIQKSENQFVSSRELGSFLKSINFPGNHYTLLGLLKSEYEGLAHFIAENSHLFIVQKTPTHPLPSSIQTDNTFWIAAQTNAQPTISSQFQSTNFTQAEQAFMDHYFATVSSSYIQQRQYNSPYSPPATSLSIFTLCKLIFDFIQLAPTDQVASRNLGKYLKSLQFADTTILTELKRQYNGLLSFFLRQAESIFSVENPDGGPSFSITLTKRSQAILSQQGQQIQLFDAEKEFFKRYYMDYQPLDLNQLKELCTKRLLPTTGRKSELIQRIQQYDFQHLVELQPPSSLLEGEWTSTTASDDELDATAGEDVSISVYALNKIIFDRLTAQRGSGFDSSRDMGMYLKSLAFGSSTTILDELKRQYNGLLSFLSQQNSIFVVTWTRPHDHVNDNDHGGEGSNAFYVGIAPNAETILSQQAQETVLTQTERDFFQQHQLIDDDDGDEHLVDGNDDDDFGKNKYYDDEEEWDVLSSPPPYREDVPLARTEMDYATLTVSELKKLCQDRSLPVSGRKAELVERLQQYDADNDEWIQDQEPPPVPLQQLSVAEKEVDYASLTVPQLKKLCRDRELPVSGRKIELIDRIQEYDASQLQQEKWITSQSNHHIAVDSNNNRPEIMTRRDTTTTTNPPATHQYLVNLVKEYLVVSGGMASCRNLGRYLSHQPSYSQKNGETALGDVKNTFGSVWNFINAHSPYFRVETNTAGLGYKYAVRLNE